MKYVSVLAMVFFSFLSLPNNLDAIVIPVSQEVAVQSVFELDAGEIINLDRKSLQKKIG